MFASRSETNCFASSSVPPLPTMCAHAARMFQRAAPDEPGLGVTISTSGLARSSHDSMPSGLPLRTTKTTTEEVAMPLVGVASFQSSATRPSSTSRVTSVSSEKWT